MGHCAELTTPSLGLRRPWGKQGQPSWSQRLVGGCGQNSACLNRGQILAESWVCEPIKPGFRCELTPEGSLALFKVRLSSCFRHFFPLRLLLLEDCLLLGRPWLPGFFFLFRAFLFVILLWSTSVHREDDGMGDESRHALVRR